MAHTSQLTIDDLEPVLADMCQQRLEIDARHEAIYLDMLEAYNYSGTGGTPSATTLAGLLFHGLINDTSTATAMQIERAQAIIDAATEIHTALASMDNDKLRRLS